MAVQVGRLCRATTVGRGVDLGVSRPAGWTKKSFESVAARRVSSEGVREEPGPPPSSFRGCSVLERGDFRPVRLFALEAQRIVAGG